MTTRSTSALSALAFASLVAGLAACGCGSKSAAPTGPTPGGGPTGDDVGAIDIRKLGAPCGDGDRCEAGSCVTYYGIAGPSGPEFKSCEVACTNGKGPCPTGAACVTIADGPGAVCRPADVLEGGPAVD